MEELIKLDKYKYDIPGYAIRTKFLADKINYYTDLCNEKNIGDKIKLTYVEEMYRLMELAEDIMKIEHDIEKNAMWNDENIIEKLKLIDDKIGRK